MTSFEETGPSTPITEGIRVDKVKPRARLAKNLRAIIVIIVAIVLLVPVAVMVLTAFKSRADVVSVPPKVVFEPTLEGLVFLLTERSQLSGQALEEAKANAENLGIFDRVALENGQRINGPSDFLRRLRNSIIIAFGATIASVTLGLFAAYGFSRFEVPGANDLLFFILSGRMLPAVVVTIPIFLMYRQLQSVSSFLQDRRATGGHRHRSDNGF
jgi:multiple sugar transport system permease protein